MCEYCEKDTYESKKVSDDIKVSVDICPADSISFSAFCTDYNPYYRFDKLIPFNYCPNCGRKVVNDD